jgi:hypothetical protein
VASLFTLLLFSSSALAVSQLTLHVGDIQQGQVKARGAALRISLGQAGPLTMRADSLQFGKHQWRQVELRCEHAVISDSGAIDCAAGILSSAEDNLPLSFQLDLAAKRLQLVLRPDDKERWTLDTHWIDAGWQGRLRAEQGRLQRLNGLVELPFSVTSGLMHGQADFIGTTTHGLSAVSGNVQVENTAFNNASGTHAAESLALGVEFAASHSATRWDWRLDANWKSGEVYWQPFYFARGGHRLQAVGALDETFLGVTHANLALADVGSAKVSATLRRNGRVLESMVVEALDLNTAVVYELLLKPMLEHTMLANLEMGGRADIGAQWNDGRLTGFDVALRDFDVEDKGGRFALYKVNARVPWALSKTTQAALHYDGGRVLKLPLGDTNLAATLNGYSLTAPQLRLPLLDGALTLQDVSAAFLNKQWHWHLGASLSPLSMADFTHAVGWPTMQGKVAASIPLVTYSNGRMTTQGEMGMNVFDGSVVVRNLLLQDPLGLAPRLNADIQMRDLDLELLTRTFSFGAMTGRLDVDVNELELSRWQPVKFDAAVRSSPGKYSKKISQRAVENISALGGAGATAAIQRSFLRFFKEFNYAQIGLSCRLHNGMCQMDGVEPVPGGYVIVKGSGVPAITVLGYNRSVSWGELLTRLKRVTQGGTAPVVK